MLQNYHRQARGGLSLLCQTCWPTYPRAPTGEKVNKLFTRPLEWRKGHVCCCLKERKSIRSALKSNILSALRPCITQRVNTEWAWERFEQQQWWIDAVRFGAAPSSTNAQPSAPGFSTQASIRPLHEPLRCLWHFVVSQDLLHKTVLTRRFNQCSSVVLEVTPVHVWKSQRERW